jgi:O-antigen ligase
LSADKWIVLFCLLSLALAFRGTTLTDTFREGIYLVIDVLLPYYVVSRGLRNVTDFTRVFVGLLVSAVILGTLGIFESTKGWMLYNDLLRTLDTDDVGFYHHRGEFLRASTVFASPIIYGYVLMIGFAALVYLRINFTNTLMMGACGMVLVLSLIFTWSRGPWIGIVVFVFIYVLVFVRKNKLGLLYQIGTASLLAALIISVAPGGDRLTDYIPFLGGRYDHTVTYRERLLLNGIEVVKQNPFLGAPRAEFKQTRELQELRQGSGLIDVVNTYLRIALGTGLTGLSIFLIIFASLLRRTNSIVRRWQTRDLEVARIGAVLLACTISILVVIATVSPYGRIPTYYWLMAGLLSAYTALPGHLKYKAKIAKENVTSNLTQQPPSLAKDTIT